MSDSKTIKFKFELDNQSFQQVQNAIKSLASELQKLGGAGGGLLGGGGAFPGLSIGGTAPSKSTQVARSNQKAQQGGGQQQTMGKVILDNAQAFKKFANEGKDASKIMTDALKRDIGEQEKALDGLKKRLGTLSDEFTIATRKQKEFIAAGHAPEASVMGKYIKRIESEIAATSGQTLKGAKGLAGSQEALAAAGGPQGGFGGFMGRMGYTGTGFGGAGGGTMGMIGGIGKLAGGVAMAVVAGVQEHMAGTRMYGAAEASRGGMINSELDALRRGDVSSIQARRMILQDSDKRKDFSAQTGTASRAESWIEGIGGLAADIGAHFTGGLSNKLLGRKGGAIGSSVGTAAIEGSMMQKEMDAIAAQKASTEFQATRYATDYFINNMASRNAGARMMGMGVRRDKNGKEIDTWGDADARLKEQGYSVDQKLAAYGQTMAMGGKTFARSTHETQMRAQQAGHGGYAEAVKALAQSMGGEVGLGKKLLATTVGTVVAAGGKIGDRMDVNAGLQLAGALGGYDPRMGAIDPRALAFGHMAGFGGPSGNSLKDMMNVTAFKGGLEFANKFTTGGLDPLQVGKNTISAANALGPGASSYAIDTLATMDVRKLMAGMNDDGTNNDSIDRQAKMLGLGKEQFRSAGNAILGSMFDNYYADDDIGRAGDKFKKSGMPLQKYLFQNPEEIDLLAANMSLGSAGGLEQDTARAFLWSQGGIGSASSGRKIAPGDVGGGELDDMQKTFNKKMAEFAKEDSNKLKTDQDKIKGDFESITRQSEILKSAGTNLSTSVDNVSKALNELARKINLATGTGTVGYGNEKVKAP